MEDHPYSDREVDEAIERFRAGGELGIDEDTYVLLSDAQRARLNDALEREEWSTYVRWHRAWHAGETTEMPPHGLWTWSHVPDDPSGLIP
jgi:hypothetical protein